MLLSRHDFERQIPICYTSYSIEHGPIVLLFFLFSKMSVAHPPLFVFRNGDSMSTWYVEWWRQDGRHWSMEFKNHACLSPGVGMNNLAFSSTFYVGQKLRIQLFGRWGCWENSIFEACGARSFLSFSKRKRKWANDVPRSHLRLPSVCWIVGKHPKDGLSSTYKLSKLYYLHYIKWI